MVSPKMSGLPVIRTERVLGRRRRLPRELGIHALGSLYVVIEGLTPDRCKVPDQSSERSESHVQALMWADRTR
jgi:hypothetical protein